MNLEILIFVIIIIFLSSLVRASFGFGDALIAMPLLSLLIPVKTATALVALIAIVIAFVILVTDWKKVNIKGYIWLLIAIGAGIPVGIIYLKNAPDTVIKLFLGIVILFFAIYKLTNPDKLVLRNDKTAVIFGFVSGILGGAYNTNGPPIIIYGSLRNWNPDNFRAILQGVFLPSNVLIVGSHGISGLWSTEVLELFLYSLPLIVIAILIGHKLNKMIPVHKFSKYVYILLITISLFLIFRTVFL